MKITFPHLGNAHLLAKLFFNDIGVTVIMPSLNTQESLVLGSENSPDEICLPFKLMIANIINAYKKGADTVVMPATIGPCRLGEYGELFKNILDKKGYKLNWIILDSVNEIGLKELLKRLNHMVVSKNSSNFKLAISLKRLYNLLCCIEKLEKRVHILCGYEINKGSCKLLLSDIRKKVLKADSLNSAIIIVKSGICRLKTIPMNNKKTPLKILLTGEIYTLIEPFANQYIEDILMNKGISFEKKITIGWWLRTNILNPFYLKWHHKKKNTYMPYGIGGYAKETVEEGLRCNNNKYDGAIQLFPVGCMPEIVAKSVLSQIAEENERIKILTIIFDEMSGDAGVITRIEAFLDMLEFRRRKEKKYALYGNRRRFGKHRHSVNG